MSANNSRNKKIADDLKLLGGLKVIDLPKDIPANAKALLICASIHATAITSLGIAHSDRWYLGAMLFSEVLISALIVWCRERGTPKINNSG